MNPGADYINLSSEVILTKMYVKNHNLLKTLASSDIANKILETLEKADMLQILL